MTSRTASSKELAGRVLKAHTGAGGGHHDREWIRRRFGWKNARVAGASTDTIEPFAFFGSHAEESFMATFARELGIATLKPIKLRPEMVVVAGVDPGKLRGIVKAL